MKTRTFASLCLSVLSFGFSAQAAEPKYVAPAWAKSGTRVVFSEATAFVANAECHLVPTRDGRWLFPDGHAIDPNDPPSGGGQAKFTVLDVDHVGNDVAVSYGFYSRNPLDGSIAPAAGHTGFSAPHFTDGKYWRNPKKLAAMPEGTQAGVTVVRTQYPSGNEMRDAVRIIAVEDVGGTIDTYDLSSGLLLNESVAFCNNLGTSLATCRFEGVRDVTLPWTDMAAPAWIQNFRSARFSQDQFAVIQLAGETPHQHCTNIMKVGEVGENWMTFTLNTGGAPAESALHLIAAPATRMGLFLPPEAFGKLHAGQVLDEDKILGTRLTVSNIDANGVTLTETNRGFQLSATYDASGLLLGSETVIYVGAGTEYTRVRRLANR